MPPRYLRKASSTPLEPCSEFMVEACDIAPADQCCGVLPCTLCLEWEVYGEATAYGSASFTGSTWEGSVGGHSFLSYWEVPTLPDFYPTPELGSNSIGMSFSAFVEATYTMGSPVDEPGREANETQHDESVGAFNIAKSVVSQDQYYAVMGTNPSHFLNPKNTAVEMVSWDDAYAFCIRLSKLPAEVAMGRTYRLPTEAEWEYACRSGATGAYFFGADPANLPTYGWFATNSAGETQELQAKVPNSAGLFDTHGNVWEWTTEANEANGIVRGGAWDSTAAQCRSASRRVVDPTTKANNIGFRVVMVQGPPLPIPQFGECEYVVTLDGEEVYRATCYEGASCRYPGGSVGVTIGYDEGTLTWAKHQPRPLALVVDPDTGCNDFFCGTCRCTCECLCVTITTIGTVLSGEICNTTYSDCDPPVWEGTVAGYYLLVELGRDDYGNCIITLTADGEEAEPVLATGCSDMSASVTLYDGTIISVVCKQCGACSSGCLNGCCPGTNIENSVFTDTDCGPGALGCPDVPTRSGVTCLSGIGSISTCSPPAELQAEVGSDTCNSFCINDMNLVGSLGTYTFDAVLVCSQTGGMGRAFIMYSGTAPPGLSTGVWIETEGGFTCPDCSGENSGTEQTVEMWFDVFVNCGMCNASAIVQGEESTYCSPDSLYSMRIYFSGSVTCD